MYFFVLTWFGKSLTDKWFCKWFSELEIWWLYKSLDAYAFAIVLAFIAPKVGYPFKIIIKNWEKGGVKCPVLGLKVIIYGTVARWDVVLQPIQTYLRNMKNVHN